ncbi:putative polyketide synthase [Biscogniauxia marginata]|nr:putative polyketide synthase [Biscogniauxia marginata]
MADSKSLGPENGLLTSRQPEPIAIIGMGCRWPGGVRSPSQLWDLLKEERDGWAEFSPDRINVEGFYHPNGRRPGSMFTKGGYVLDEDPRQFDHGFFGISASEALSMDPSQRKLLEVTYEAFDSAGEPFETFHGSKTGVFVGNFNNDHQLMQFRDPDHTLPYMVTGGGPTILSNRINYVFNLQGPSLVVDTGCSASMYALHLAVQSLRNGDCDAAIVAGSNLILSPDAQVFTTKLGAASPTSRCHTFDVAADGYARAEGFGAIYLKKLPDALVQGNPIRAVVRGTSFNANGKTGGISHPSPEGQEAVIRRAYEAAGQLDPNSTGYFECHGTGTPVGDPIEVSALGKVFASGHRDQPLLIGSIKPNLGHSEPASAMSQIMKAVLALEHGEIPATIGIKNFNPVIDFEGARVKVVTEMVPWPSNVLKRVSINSFGYGGANAHCIIDHPDLVIPAYRPHGLPLSRSCAKLSLPKNGHPNGTVDGNGHVPDAGNVPTEWCQPVELVQTDQAGSRSLLLLPFSAHNDQALKAYIITVGKCLTEFDLADLLYTLGSRKSKLSHRSFLIGQREAFKTGFDVNTMVFGKTHRPPMERIGFVFTGQGAQWPEMGARLIEEYAAFRLAIHYLDGVLGQLHPKPSWTIKEVLLQSSTTSRIHEPVFSQTVCTAVQIGLVNLLRQWGIHPAVSVGHSSGEIAAAYAAGRLRASEAIVLAYTRGQVVATNQRQGLMIAVGLGADSIVPYLHGIEDDVRIAAINSPESITVSGDPSAVNKLATALSNQNVLNRILKTGDNAYHSHHMLSLGEPYEESANKALGQVHSLTKSEPPRSAVSWISSVTPEKESHSPSPIYWRQNLESPVLFYQALHVLARDEPVDLLIEIGPHPALAGPIKQIRSSLENNRLTLPLCLPSLHRGEHDVVSMLKLAGNLFLHSAPVDLAAVNATETMHQGKIKLQHGYPCIDMPQYPFTYPDKPNYFENRFSKEFRTRKHPRHDLLGARQPGGSKTHPSWRNVLRIKDLPWLEDHKLIPHVVLPAAAYISMAVEAASQMHYEDEDALPIKFIRLRNVSITSTLNLEDDELGVETVLNMEKVALTDANAKSIWFKFSIGSIVPNGDIWTEHCSGIISVRCTASTIDQDLRLCPDSRSRLLNIERWYSKFGEMGLGYGSTFQGLSNLKSYRGANIAAADVGLTTTTGSVNGGESEYPLHPATLDACLQLGLISCQAGQVENMKTAFVPIAMNDVRIWVPETPDEKGLGVASGSLLGLRGAYMQIQLSSITGEPLLDIGELRCVTYDGIPNKKVATRREPFWRPVMSVDIGSLTHNSAKAMFPPTDILSSKLDMLDILCAYVLGDIKMEDDDRAVEAQVRNHGQFATWVKQWQSLAGSREALDVSPEERKRTIERMTTELQDLPEARCIKQIYENLDKVYNGGTGAIKLLLESNLLHELFTSGTMVCGAYIQLQHMIDLLAHKNPKMRILEIGAGTGGATASVLDTLASNTTFKRFQEYTFTDSSAWCLSDAQTRFSDFRGVSFQMLDVQEDPVAQGFQPHSFDLVIAAHSLVEHNNLEKALKNIHSLIKPSGTLAIVEVTQARLSFEVLSRTVAGKWGQTKLLRNEPKWCQLLGDCGFSGVDISLNDYVEAHTISTVMLSTANQPTQNMSGKAKEHQDTYLVYRDYLPPLALAIDEGLGKRSFNTTFTNLFSYAQIPQNSSIISLVDVESSTLLNHNDQYFKALQQIITQNSTVIWVAGTTAAESASEPAVMKGMLRSIATEQISSKIAFIEVDETHLSSLSKTAELIVDKFAELQLFTSMEGIDQEYVLRSGALYVERLLPDETLNEQFRLQHGLEHVIEERSIDMQVPLRAKYKQPGVLSSLYFAPDPEFEKPLDDNWVEIKTHAIGLNFKDLAVSTAKFDSDYLSTESAGIVSRVGAAVMSLKVGDRVAGLIFGNMGNYMRSPASFLSRIPDGVTFSGAASMQLAYLTSIYALRHLAHLTKGETILIQSATGDLGMAAIRIAQHLGAEIYATAGSNEKRKALVELGVPTDHIFNSRDLGAVNDILRATKFSGIDVILSSSAEDMMHETWRCIAPLGRFIDVGRTDVLGGGKLELEIFKQNATFSSFDLSIIYRQRPAILMKLMTEMSKLWDEGIIDPINPVTTFDISQLESALSLFSKSLHIGKLVITFNNPETRLKIERTSTRVYFDPTATYVLVGCLGGLGRSLAVWMVERRARHLVFLSRTGARTVESTSVIEELTSMGANPRTIRCDVTDHDALKSAIDQISSQYPIKGVVHAAMVEGDAFFHKSKYAQIQAVLAPKVKGTLNVHHATKHLPLDFFLMTSSIVATVGTATQAAYAAANAFQGAFARLRLSQSLPATSLDLGLVLEVGSVSDSIKVQRMLQRNASYGLSETEFLQLLEGAFFQPTASNESSPLLSKRDHTSAAQIVTCFEPARFIPYVEEDRLRDFIWHNNPRFQAVVQAISDRTREHGSTAGNTADTASSYIQKLKILSLAEKMLLVREAVIQRLSKLLALSEDEIDVSKATSQYALDSLVAAEFRNWLKKTFDADVTLLQLLSKTMSIEDLVKGIVTSGE